MYVKLLRLRRDDREVSQWNGSRALHCRLCGRRGTTEHYHTVGHQEALRKRDRHWESARIEAHRKRYADGMEDHPDPPPIQPDEEPEAQAPLLPFPPIRRGSGRYRRMKATADEIKQLLSKRGAVLKEREAVETQILDLLRIQNSLDYRMSVIHEDLTDRVQLLHENLTEEETESESS